ncbi:MAG: DUF1593 domain-containing protein [Verrucomicrobia bacterium]|nr:DUF1593 domain-containing protein [Verrucomicrobiota bacterium]
MNNPCPPHPPSLPCTLAIIVACAIPCLPTPTTAAEAKPRLVVMTDIGGDPDDEQSLVRFLLYTCDFQVEGLCTGFGHGHYKNTRPDLLHKGVDAYGHVLTSLRLHRKDFPSHHDLKALIKDGSNGDAHTVGPGRDSEASEWIIRVLDRDDARPVWFAIWGGPRELAQALWKVQTTRTPEHLAAFKRKIRVHSIADQDRTADWIKKNHPDVFWIFSNGQFRGIWQGADPSLVSPAWLERHVRTGHGPLGSVYPAKASGKTGVKEGDTPSFLYVLANGLSDPEHPDWGNWGGRFERRGAEFIAAKDLRDGVPDVLYPIQRWREAYQNDFAARMDWCVNPVAQANHPPLAVLNHDRTSRVLTIQTDPAAGVKLSAMGSSDPDGHPLRYDWWTYVEAGTYWTEAPIQNAHAPEAVLTVPQNASGRTIHVILEVKDAGQPPLVAYRRAILNVRGTPVSPPPGAPALTAAPAEVDLKTPVHRLQGPPANTGPWQFYRGINVNGPAIEIDGHRWDGDDTPHFVCQNRPLNNPQVALRPPTDPARAQMIHSFRWNHQPSLAVTGVPDGTYAVYAYVWEETQPETFTVRLNGKVVAPQVHSGPAGCWQRLGPWQTRPSDGRLTITASGGAANFSGIEIWQRR